MVKKYWGGWVPPAEPAAKPAEAPSAARVEVAALQKVGSAGRPSVGGVAKVHASKGQGAPFHSQHHGQHGHGGGPQKTAALRAAAQLNSGSSPAGVGGWRHFAKQNVVQRADWGGLPF
eukprot:Hpha_TRINITY_DN28775_c0_g1::TRINITY_DN28775_c0_g1_i1::g.42426::m.42426